MNQCDKLKQLLRCSCFKVTEQFDSAEVYRIPGGIILYCPWGYFIRLHGRYYSLDEFMKMLH